MLRTALTLAARGMHVFPCMPRDKRPATEHGLHDATTDRQIIRQWWHQDPTYNIAVATGAASRLFVIDIDGLDAELELRKLEAGHGLLPPSVEVITSRGRHVYFQWPDCAIRNSASRIAPGIDVRGEGGYVLVPPSIHPSGRQYFWSVDTGNSLAAAPQWLIDKIGERVNGNGKPQIPPSEWRTLVADGVDEGQRNNAATRLCGYLLRHHIDAVVTLELLQLWNAARCRPPLDADEVAAIVDSIAARELKRRGA